MSEMRPKIDPDLPTPLYFQICEHFRQRIRLGRLAPGDKLPSEKDIESAFGVSRITAQRALNELAKEGLVERQRGKGTTVSASLPPSGLVGAFSGLRQGISDIVETTRVEVLGFGYVPANPTIARALEIAESATVQRAIRLRWAGPKPFSFSVAHTREDIGRSFSREELTQNPMLALIEAAGHKLAEADQTVSARNATDKIAAALHIAPETAVLNVRRVLFDDRGLPVQHIDVIYNPDAYHLHIRTTADSAGGPDGALGEL